MNENENKPLLGHSEVPAEQLIRSRDEQLAHSRRRLLRAGVKAAPVVLATLASRPSLACHCVVPSAWGSINAGFGGVDQDMGDVKLTGSLVRQHGAKVNSFGSTYTFSNWQSTSGDCWNKIINLSTVQYPSNLFWDIKSWDTSGKNTRKRKYVQGRYANTSKNIPAVTVAKLCGWIASPVPRGFGDYKPFEVIEAERFAGAILVAELNIKLGKSPLVCIQTATDSNIVFTMASGSYQAEGQPKPWEEQDIVDYLHFNWLARNQ